MTEAKYYKIKQLAVDLFTSNGIIALQGSPEKLDCNFSFDIDPISKYLNELYQSDAPLPESDHQLSLKIHDMLTDGKIPENFINDMRFWQWISIECFSEYIGWRWQINHLQPTANRYLGGGGATGYSTNSISRLFVPAKILLIEKNGDKLLESFWDNKQKEQSILQNEQAINTKIFVAMVKAFQGKKTSEIVQATTRLSTFKNSTCFDVMDEDELIETLLN
jgi:hypothetical protein